MSIFSSLAREIRTTETLIRTLRWTKAANDRSTLVPDDLAASVEAHADRTAFVFGDDTLTYAELDARANRFAHWALMQGLNPGDRVALMLGNCPDYVAVWYGLSKIGVVTALINTNLAGASLTHCLEVSGAKHLIFGADLAGALNGAALDPTSGLRLWALGKAPASAREIEPVLADLPETAPDPALRDAVDGRDTCLLVFTSGTTGLPKAARLTHMRTRHLMRSFIAVCRVTAEDRIHVPLPLYHSTGGVCGIGVGLLTGAAIVLTPRFSARRFWDEVRDAKSTVLVYVGEVCRFLLRQPPGARDTEHTLRTAFGNGLRAETWTAFSKRFGLTDIHEAYGSTEGNVGLINFDATPGAVGRVPPYLRRALANIRLIALDPVTAEPERTDAGLCREAEIDAPGEMIGEISDAARKRFDGYEDSEATDKKLLRNVFKPGDAWFRTGDLMRRDAKGYFFFVDRLGDTFRWKGENVSTEEVAAVLLRQPGIAVANVYGVEVPGCEGRAGMAAITAEPGFDPVALAKAISQDLPAYARPVFLREQAEPDTTDTFKLKKTRLQTDGFDPRAIDDRLWVIRPRGGGYVPLTPVRYDEIIAGNWPL